VQILKLGMTGASRGGARTLASVLRRTAEIFYGLYFLIVFLLWIIPTCTTVRFIKDYREAGRFTSSALKLLFALVFIRLRVVGKEYMNTLGAKIYAANHTSYFDVLALMNGLGVPYRFVAKSEVHQMPFIGTFLRQMGHLSFNRLDAESRLKQSREMEEFLRNGESVFVFPEGTFVPEDGLRPFQLGAFKAAVDTGAPIIPVSIAGSRSVLRDGTILPRFSSVTLTLSPPIYPRASQSAESEWQEVIRLRDLTRDAIAPHTGESVL